ncbi:MAG: hypothetical protein AAF674_12865 [Pseudomonadota bacterium]
MTVAAMIGLAIVSGLAIAFASQALVNRYSSPQTQALTELVQAWRFGDTDRREAAYNGIAKAFSLDAPDVPADDQVRRVMAAHVAAELFDRRYGRFHWGVRTQALISQRWPLPGDRGAKPKG